MTGQIINGEGRGRETPSLDSIFRDPDLLCSLPGLQVIKSTNYWEPCKNRSQVRGDIDEKVHGGKELRNECVCAHTVDLKRFFVMLNN